MDFLQSIHIDRDQQSVYEYITDINRMSHWHTAITSVTLVEGGGFEKGAKLQIKRELLFGSHSDIATITEVSPPDRAALVIEDGPTPLIYHYSLTPVDSDTTELTIKGSLQLKGFLCLFQPLANRFLARGVQHNLEILKSLMETPPASKTR